MWTWRIFVAVASHTISTLLGESTGSAPDSCEINRAQMPFKVLMVQSDVFLFDLYDSVDGGKSGEKKPEEESKLKMLYLRSCMAM